MIDLRNLDSPLVQIGAFSPRRSEELFCDRLVDYSCHQLAFLLKSNGHCKTWVTVGKISRAVEGVDDPAMTPVPLLTASLFRHDGVPGEVAPQPANNRILGAPVGLRNKINFPLVADFCRVIELRNQNAASLERRLYRYFQKLIAHLSRNRRCQFVTPPL